MINSCAIRAIKSTHLCYKLSTKDIVRCWVIFVFAVTFCGELFGIQMTVATKAFYIKCVTITIVILSGKKYELIY